MLNICMYGEQSGNSNCYFCKYFSTLNSKCAYEYINKRLEDEKEQETINFKFPRIKELNSEGGYKGIKA